MPREVDEGYSDGWNAELSVRLAAVERRVDAVSDRVDALASLVSELARECGPPADS